MEKPQKNGFIVYFRLVQNQTTGYDGYTGECKI